MPDPKTTQTTQKQLTWAERTAKTGYFFLTMLTGALILIILGWWGYSQVMTQLFGRYELFGVQSSSDINAGLFVTQKVILLDPMRTEAYLRPVTEDTLDHPWPYRQRIDGWPLADTLWYPGSMQEDKELDKTAWEYLQKHSGKKQEANFIDYWKHILFRLGVPFSVIVEQDLPRLEKATSGVVLVLPAALLLSIDERQAIKDFVARGGGVVLCWLPGCRDELGNWVGLDFLTFLTGGVPSVQIKDSTGGASMVLKANSPITGMLPPGQHLDFFTYNGYTALRIVEGARTFSDAFLFSPYWQESDKPRSDLSTVVHGTYVDGRFVWFSFTPETAQPNKDNNVIVDKLVANAINWVGGKPVPDVHYWPDGYRGAGSLVVRSGQDNALLESVILRLNSADVVPDLIFFPQVDQTSVNWKNLKVGEVFIGYEKNSKLHSLTPPDQIKWLKSEIQQVEKQIGKPPIGLYPTDWTCNELVYPPIAKAGLSYLFSDPKPRYYGARYLKIKTGKWYNWFSKTPIWLMPKNQISLGENYQYRGIQNQPDIVSAMAEDIERIAYSGGTYIGIINPSYLEPLEEMTLPLFIAEEMDSSGMWRTNTSRLMQRYAGCKDVRVTATTISSTRLRVAVTNEGIVKLTNLNVEVYLPDAVSDASVSTELVGIQVTKKRWNPDTKSVIISLNELNPRANANIFLDVNSKTTLFDASEQNWFRRLLIWAAPKPK